MITFIDLDALKRRESERIRAGLGTGSGVVRQTWGRPDTFVRDIVISAALGIALGVTLAVLLCP